MIDRKVIQHAAYVLGNVPDFARHPTVGDEQLDRQTCRIHGNRHQMAERVIGVLGRFVIVDRGRLYGAGHALGPQEGVEMAMFAGTFLLRVRVVIILRMADRVVDIAIGIVVPLVEGCFVFDQLATDIVVGQFQHPQTFQNPVAGVAHRLQPLAR